MANLLKNKLLIIIILASVLRLFMLGSVPTSLNWDEVSQGYSAYSIAQTAKDEWGVKFPLFFRSYGEWKSAVYIYLLVPLVKIFGLSAYIVRLPSAVFGILSVYLIFLIGKKLYSENVGLWAAFLMAVTPWSLFLSRPAFEANVALSLVLAGVYLFITQKYFFSAFLFGLAPHTYNSAKVVVPVLAIYLIYHSQLHKNLKKLSIFLTILALFALPLLVNLSSGASQTRFNQVSITTDGKELQAFYHLRRYIKGPEVIGKIIINKSSFFVYKFIGNSLSYFDPRFLFWEGGTHTQQSLPYHGVLYITEFLLITYALFHKKWNLHLPLALILIGLMPAAMTRDPGHVLRSVMAMPGFIILAAMGITQLGDNKFKYLRLFNVFLIAEILIFLTSYFSWYGPAYARDWQYGYQEVSSFLQHNEAKYDHIVFTKWFGEPQLFLAFYGKWDPDWYQKENFQNLRYEQVDKMWLDQLDSYFIGKYTFKYISWSDETRDKKTLYIGKFDDFPGVKIIKSIHYPDGTVAFNIVEGDR